MYRRQQLEHSRFFLVFIAGLAALGPLSIDAYLPALPEVAEDLGTSLAWANLTLSSFMIGMAIGQFLGGPLSDQLGRRFIGLSGLAIYVSATFLIVFASSIEQVLSLRLIQAIGGGFASVICLAQVRDVFEPDQVTKKFANIVMVILLAPMFAPLLGALISYWGWRAIFVGLGIYGVAMTLIYVLVVPETNDHLPEKFSTREIFTGYWAAISKRTNGRLIGLRLALFSGFGAGVLFSYVINAASILIGYFHLSKFEFSIVFGVMIFALMIGNRLTVRLLSSTSALQIIKSGNLVQVTVAGLLSVLYYRLLWCYGASNQRLFHRLIR